MGEIDETAVLGELGDELAGGNPEDRSQRVGDDVGVGDDQRVGDDGALGHRFGQHLATAVVDAAPHSGHRHLLGQLGCRQGRVVLVGELLDDHQPSGHGHEDDNQDQPKDAGPTAEEDGGAQGAGELVELGLV